MAYLKSLVDCRIFEHIYLNFLPVGHTHCDIDQLFSRVATFLKGEIPWLFHSSTITLFIKFCIRIPSIDKPHSAFTWDELAEAIWCSYVGINQVLVLKSSSIGVSQ